MAATLAIRRLALRFETPASPAEATVRRIAVGLRARLEARLRRHDGGEGDETVVLIPRLEITLDHPADGSADALADRLADAILMGIARSRATDAVGLRFASRTMHAAAFIEALVSGTAWSRWWFRGFQGLRALPVGRAVRTLCDRDWGRALAILRDVQPAERERLWRLMESADADAILAGIAEAGISADATAGLASVADDDPVWDRLAAVLVAMPTAPAPVAALAALCALDDADAVPTVIRALRDLAQPSPAPRDPRIDPISVQGANLAMPLRRAVARLRRDRGTRTPPTAERWRGSPLLGYAILWPELDQCHLDQVCAGWPAPAAGLQAVDLVRLLVLSACAGPAGEPWRDPVWRDAFGVPGSFGDLALAAWVQRVGLGGWRTLARAHASGQTRPLPATPPGPSPATYTGLPASDRGTRRMARLAVGRVGATLLGDFATRLPGFAGASAAFLRANLLGAGGIVQMHRTGVQVRLTRPPLDILLGMTGLANRDIRLRDGRMLRLERQP